MLAAQNQRIAAIQLLSAFTTRPQNILPAGQRKIDSQIFRRVNRTDKMGRTALHRTAVNGQTEAMKILHTVSKEAVQMTFTLYFLIVQELCCSCPGWCLLECCRFSWQTGAAYGCC